MTEFTPHGEFTLEIRGRLLLVEVAGPWNLELIENYGEQTRPLAEHLARTGPWVLISITRDSALFTPEAIEALRQTAAAHARSMKRIATAYVVDPSVEGYHFVEAIFLEIYRDICPVAVFERRDDAERWALDQLAAARPA